MWIGLKNTDIRWQFEILTDEGENLDGLAGDMNVNDLVCVKYAPINSVNDENVCSQPLKVYADKQSSIIQSGDHSKNA